MQIEPKIDVIIPCYNGDATIERAINSALAQAACHRVLVVDDCSTDDSTRIIDAIARRMPERVMAWRLLANSGPACARNHALSAATSDFVAFLDADDVYEPQALDAAYAILQKQCRVALVRLALKPVGQPVPFTDHPGFPRAWRMFEMTSATNIVVRRTVINAAGGFPEDQLFRRFGGEDGALGLAIVATCGVGTLFDQPGVLYNYHGAFAERLLRANLLNEVSDEVRAHVPQAEEVTRRISQRLELLDPELRGEPGIAPILVQWATSTVKN